VIVGAGLAGLATALHLASSGRQITVLERADVPGGRAGVLRDQGFTFDTGPTVLTMPELVSRAFAAVGEKMTDWLTLRQVDPAYRAFYPDGSSLDILTNQEQMSDQVRVKFGETAARDYARYVEFLANSYRWQISDFIDRNIDSPLDMLTPNLLRLAAAGGFGRLESKARRYLRDPRLLRAFTFQSMYAGMAPQRALALYAVISYMDCVSGVYVPEGGMHQLPTAMAQAAAKHGVQFRFGTSAAHVEHHGGRATAVVTTNGERIPCDVAVLNADLPVARRDLLGEEPWSIQRLKMSPSAVVLLAGSSTRYSQIAHHNIHFGSAWRSTFRELIDDHQVMKDPSLFVSHLSKDDASLAPDGKHSYYVLFPAPNQESGIDWATAGPRYMQHMLQVLQARGYTGFARGMEVSHLTTPQDWQEQGMEQGSPFSAAHTFWQTGPFRPGNLWGENVVFTGSGTVPGVGVPMVLISGRLAAQRISR
jgi:phytoene desaturase